MTSINLLPHCLCYTPVKCLLIHLCASCIMCCCNIPAFQSMQAVYEGHLPMGQSSEHACTSFEGPVTQGTGSIEGEWSNKGGLSSAPNSLHQQGCCGGPLLPLAHGGEANKWPLCKHICLAACLRLHQDVCLHPSCCRHGVLQPRINGGEVEGR